MRHFFLLVLEHLFVTEELLINGTGGRGVTELREATEPVEDLRRPPKDMESQLPLRGILDDEVKLMTWWGTQRCRLL